MLVSTGVSLAERAAIEDLYAIYVQSLDARDYDAWIDLFAEDCTYVVKARENEDRNFPLSLLAFESKGMLRDRIYGITNTLFHEPYYQRHLVSNFIMRGSEADGFLVECSYLVLRTKSNALTDVYSTGRYRDRIVLDGGSLRFAEKKAIYDSELIPNSLIYPI
jgi:salicylate 5-hydroxylase small subunit